MATNTSPSTVSYAQLARLGYAAPTGPIVGQPTAVDTDRGLGGLGPTPGGDPPAPTATTSLLSASPPVASTMGAWGGGAGAAAATAKTSSIPKGAWGRKVSPGRGATASNQNAFPAGPPGAAMMGRGRWGAYAVTAAGRSGTAAAAAVATGGSATEDEPEAVVRRNKKGHKVCCTALTANPEHLVGASCVTHHDKCKMLQVVMLTHGGRI